MLGDISGLNNMDAILQDSVETEKSWEVVGHHKEYKEIIGFRRFLNDHLGTNFDVDYNLVADYDWVEHTYVDGTKLSQRFFAPIQEQLFEHVNQAAEYAKQQTKKIKQDFSIKFQELDAVLNKKLTELEECTKNEKEAQRRIQESQAKLEWLKDIQNKTNSILDI